MNIHTSWLCGSESDNSIVFIIRLTMIKTPLISKLQHKDWDFAQADLMFTLQLIYFYQVTDLSTINTVNTAIS